MNRINYITQIFICRQFKYSIILNTENKLYKIDKQNELLEF